MQDSLVMVRKLKTVSWEAKYLEKRKEILPNSVEEYVPSIIPPLFDIQMDGELTAVVTQESLPRDKTAIDIWKKDRYLGSVDIPLLYAQQFVFPPPFSISVGFCIDSGKLYSVHYDTEEDLFRFCTWQIMF